MSDSVDVLIVPDPQVYPPNAICCAEGCFHQLDAHDKKGDNGRVRCSTCLRLVNGGAVYTAPIYHKFEPMRFAGRALTPDAEKAAYEKAMRGE